jgi:hypothetical protein
MVGSLNPGSLKPARDMPRCDDRKAKGRRWLLEYLFGLDWEADAVWTGGRMLCRRACTGGGSDAHFGTGDSDHGYGLGGGTSSGPDLRSRLPGLPARLQTVGVLPMHLYLAGAVRPVGIWPRRHVRHQSVFCRHATALGARSAASPRLLKLILEHDPRTNEVVCPGKPWVSVGNMPLPVAGEIDARFIASAAMRFSHLSSSGCTQAQGTVCRSSVSLIMCTGGL